MAKQKKNRKARDEFRYSVYLYGLSDPIASLRGLWICVVRQSHRRRTNASRYKEKYRVSLSQSIETGSLCRRGIATSAPNRRTLTESQLQTWLSLIIRQPAYSKYLSTCALHDANTNLETLERKTRRSNACVHVVLSPTPMPPQNRSANISGTSQPANYQVLRRWNTSSANGGINGSPGRPDGLLTGHNARLMHTYDLPWRSVRAHIGRTCIHVSEIRSAKELPANSRALCIRMHEPGIQANYHRSKDKVEVLTVIDNGIVWKSHIRWQRISILRAAVRFMGPGVTFDASYRFEKARYVVVSRTFGA